MTYSCTGCFSIHLQRTPLGGLNASISFKTRAACKIVIPECFYRGSRFYSVENQWIPAQNRCGNDKKEFWKNLDISFFLHITINQPSIPPPTISMAPVSICNKLMTSLKRLFTELFRSSNRLFIELFMSSNLLSTASKRSSIAFCPAFSSARDSIISLSLILSAFSMA